MTIIFWMLTGLILYAYAGYPMLIGLMARIGGRRRGMASRMGDLPPTVSLLVPAYNEERIIAAKIENTLRLEYPSDRLEVIVASESDDGTDAIVARYATRGVRLVSSDLRRGKVANLHRAVPHAQGEILVFSDANAMLRPDALSLMMRHFADPRIGAVSGRLVYSDEALAGDSPAGEGAYWRFEQIVKRASSALGSLPGANGSLFAVRAELYRPISERRGDDFELPVRVILDGKESILEPDAISVEPTTASYADEFRRKVRIINWMSTSAAILLKESIQRGRALLAFQLLSHKLNRWAVPCWLLGLIPVSAALIDHGRIYEIAVGAQVAIYGLALAGWLLDRAGVRPPVIWALPYYFVVVNIASLIGLATAALGHEVSWHKRSDPS